MNKYLFALLLPVSVALAGAPEFPGFHIAGGNISWGSVLRAYGLQPVAAEQARVLVVREAAANSPQEWIARVEAGAVLITEGDTPLGRALGFRATRRTRRVQEIRDTRYPEVKIRWEAPFTIPEFEMPQGAKVLVRKKGAATPLMAYVHRGRGAVLWMAIPPGEEGFERFPYIPQALVELGVQPPFAARRLWAFFDPAYRLRPTEELFASWRKSGISALHVATWNNWERDEEADEYLTRLITECHRHGVLVYAWLELPHVSDRFWNEHPQWREKTAYGKDAYVPWRRLMNLANPECHRAVAEGLRTLMSRFDWDGLNFAELYFDGVMGVANPEEFTPLNDDVRAEVKRLHGFDPMELFHGRRDPQKLRTFLDYRADLAARLQENWVAEMEKLRAEKPGLDLVLTYVDDQFDKNMRDAIGADAARSLKVLDKHPMTFLIEDPATVWHLGPGRYHEIGKKYDPLTKHQELLAVDINFVDRGKKQTPTGLQTGVELMQLVRAASEAFARVAFYSESTVLPVDLPLLAPASAVVETCERNGDGWTVTSPYGVGVRWSGPATADGKPWPWRDGEHVWLTPGKHTIQAGGTVEGPALVDFNGDARSVAGTGGAIEIEYSNPARALALFDRQPQRLTLDGVESKLDLKGQVGAVWTLRLPSGAHKAVVGF